MGDLLILTPEPVELQVPGGRPVGMWTEDADVLVERAVPPGYQSRSVLLAVAAQPLYLMLLARLRARRLRQQMQRPVA
jgi:hypothetical protein